MHAILAGAPANNRTRLHMAFLQTGMDVHATPRSWISPDRLAAVHDAVLKACAGKFGELTTIGMLRMRFARG